MSGDEFGGADVETRRGGRNHGGHYVDDRGIERDRWDRPLLPHPVTGDVQAWARPSTLARTLDDGYTLEQWKLRQCVVGMSRREGLIARAATLNNDEEGKGPLGKIVAEALAAADSSRGADLGTAFHRVAELVHAGATLDQLNIPSTLRKDVDAYLSELDRLRITPVPEYGERTSVCLKLNTGGTADDYVKCADGMWRVLDRKTGQNDHKYGQMAKAIQLAAYAHGAALWNVNQRDWDPFPEPIDLTTGLIAHVPAGRGECRIYPVDLTEGFRLAQLAVQVREERKNQSRLMGMALDPPPPPEPDSKPDPANVALESLAMLRIRGAQSVSDLISTLMSLTPSYDGSVPSRDVMDEAIRQYARLQRADLWA